MHFGRFEPVAGFEPPHLKCLQSCDIIKIRKAVRQMKYKKERGQNRKLKILIDNMHLFVPFENTDVRYEHFHVPSGNFISSPKTSGKVKTAFCKAVFSILFQLFPV